MRESKRTIKEMVEDIFEVVERREELTPSLLQKELNTNYESVKSYVSLIKLIQSKPRLIFEEDKIRRGVDWIDPFIREQIGYSPNPRVALYVELLDRGATSEQSAVQIDEFPKESIGLLRKGVMMEHLSTTKDLRVYLTELGKMIAEGAKKVY